MTEFEYTQLLNKIEEINNKLDILTKEVEKTSILLYRISILLNDGE